MYCVYKHLFPNNKIYIGITSKKNPNDRWHNGKGYSNKHLCNAIKKYGWENVKHDILFSDLTKEEAEQKEIELIALYKSNKKEFGYNIAKGGKSNNGFHHSEETKEKISNSLKGVPHTVERKNNQSNALKELWKNEDYRKRMSAVHVGKQRGKNHVMSKIVYQYTKDDELINVYESVRDAERKTGIDRRQISSCCNHRLKSCHGYLWSYERLN